MTFTPRVVVLAMCLIAFGCKDEVTPPPPLPPYVPTIQLSMEDASCTEAWLKVKLTDSVEPRTVALKRDSQTVLTVRLMTSDSILIDENLLPRRTYTYRVFRLNGATPTDSSTPVQVTTMDTTSHNFTWQIDTLGVTASSLSDVAIINDTLAYAVGEMYLRDSTGQLDPIPYNMAKWDGSNWHIMRIQFFTICGQSSRTPYPAKSVFAFGTNDIWIAMYGDQIARWDGEAQTATMCLPVSFTINKLWGENANSMYAVGASGNIMHYNGSTWQRVESGTTLDIRDIWGSTNSQTGQTEVLALASTFSTQVQESRLLKIMGNSVSPLDNAGLSPSLRGIWFVPSRRYYAVGAGIHQKRMLGDSLWRVYPSGQVTSYHSGGVRGSAVNDVFVAGSFREIVHFNGVTWYRYANLLPGSSGSFGPIATRGGLMVTVGLVSPQALVAIARR